MRKRLRQGMVLFCLCGEIAAARQDRAKPGSPHYYWCSPLEVVARLHAGTLAIAPRVLVNGQCWVYTLKTKDDQPLGEQDDRRTDAQQERRGFCRASSLTPRPVPVSFSP